MSNKYKVGIDKHRVVYSLEGNRKRLCGSPARSTRRGCVGRAQDAWEVFPPVDGDMQNLVQSLVYGRIRHSNGCYVIP